MSLGLLQSTGQITADMDYQRSQGQIVQKEGKSHARKV